MVARKIEEGWQEATVCCRVVSTAGREYEVQASKGARQQWEGLAMRVSYQTDLPRGVVRQHMAAERTGIRAGVFIKLQFPLKKMGRSQESFQLSCLRDAAPVPPGALEQVASDAIVNVAGIVHSVGLLPPGYLQRRRI